MNREIINREASTQTKYAGEISAKKATQRIVGNRQRANKIAKTLTPCVRPEQCAQIKSAPAVTPAPGEIC
jgi:hypothetical protein